MAEFNKDYVAEHVLEDKQHKMECAMFLQSCLTTEDIEQLKSDWNKAGGHKVIPIWRYAFENISVKYERQGVKI